MSFFRHGVASGDPLADRVILWTRVTGARPTAQVTWTLARDPGLVDVVAEGEASADADADHTVKVDATGLEADATYYYGFEVDGERSPTARTRTLSAGGCAGARFAVTSCSKFPAGWFNAFGRIAEREDLAFVLHLGDYIYEFGETFNAPGARIGRPLSPPHSCSTLADYRRRYAHHRTDPDVLALHAALPMIATIDDHELADDAWRDGAGNHDPERDGPWPERRAAALRAWREWMPVRVDADDRIPRAFSLGDLARLVVLDTRTRRDEQTKGPSLADPARTLLGPEQREWLLGELGDGDRDDAAWYIVASGVMVGQVASDFMHEEVGSPLSELGILAAADDGPSPDQWDGYPAERDRLFAALEQRGAGDVVILSGDVHTAWAVELRRHADRPEEPPLAVEFVTPSVTTENLDEETGAEPGGPRSRRIETRLRRQNPHVRWVDLDRHGYIVVDVSPARVRGEFWFVERIDRRTDVEELACAWETLRGDPGLRRLPEP